MRLDFDRAHGPWDIRIAFTDQRLTAHGGMIVWSHFLHRKNFRRELSAVLPHAPTGPNADTPTDIALGYLGGGELAATMASQEMADERGEKTVDQLEFFMSAKLAGAAGILRFETESGREAGPPRGWQPGLPLVRLEVALRLRPRRALSSAEAA